MTLVVFLFYAREGEDLADSRNAQLGLRGVAVRPDRQVLLCAGPTT